MLCCQRIRRLMRTRNRRNTCCSSWWTWSTRGVWLWTVRTRTASGQHTAHHTTLPHRRSTHTYVALCSSLSFIILGQLLDMPASKLYCILYLQESLESLIIDILNTSIILKWVKSLNHCFYTHSSFMLFLEFYRITPQRLRWWSSIVW